ncbi:methyl-accepting chemotaxis protein [Streptomyces bambusae]|uniref:methyl-accepting chemotaxis protein n=1 Tax=Streptomyces bambusae TaxID=1550616 RepID=UPI001CFDA4D1|nr:methyl-accepting chemotaxis protein [Streptomyces bambusae]MCB5166312.1 methyl-accepting chemotaxis protein [Streptomyces bambusae]
MPVGALATAPEVASQIRNLADRPGLASRRDELTTLADALQGIGGGDLDPWTELDLLAAYARPESLDALDGTAPEPVWWARLEVFIGALVFVPLLITWFGLSRATSAYEALIGAEPKAAARPFLQLWQSGFEGHLTGLFTFGHVATAATTAILLLFALVSVHGWRRAQTERRAEQTQRTADALLAELVPALTRAQLLLNERRLSSPQRFAAELAGAAATLGRLGEQALKVHHRLDAAAAAVETAVQSAEQRIAHVESAVRPLELAVGRVETAVAANADDIEQAVASLTGPLEKNGERLELAVAESGTSVRQALADVRTVSGEVRDAIGAAGDQVEDSVNTMAAAQRSFTTSTELATDISVQVLSRLGEVTDRTAEAVATSQQAVLRLDAQTGALREAAERFAELAEAMAALPAARPYGESGAGGRYGDPAGGRYGDSAGGRYGEQGPAPHPARDGRPYARHDGDPYDPDPYGPAPAPGDRRRARPAVALDKPAPRDAAPQDAVPQPRDAVPPADGRPGPRPADPR